MLRLGKKVMIVADSFEQNLPVGEYGYIIAYERNSDNAFDYVIRIPKLNKNVYVPASDIELEQTMLEREAERVQKEALIDYALATNNKALFEQIMGGGQTDASAKSGKDVQSHEEFIRQINTKAWI